MKYAKIVATLCLGLLLTVAHAQQTASAPGTGTVTGHVTCGDTQRLARGAQVSLVPLPPKQERVSTDANEAPTIEPVGEKPPLIMVQSKTLLDGSFVIRGLPAGDYYAVATMLGYVLPIAPVEVEDAHLPAKVDLSKLLANVPVVHVEAERTSTIDLSMKRGAVIAGRVAFDDGSPATNVQLWVQPAEGKDLMGQYLGPGLGQLTGQGMFTWRTDYDGRYRIAGLAPGKYTVRVMLQMNGASWTTGAGNSSNTTSGSSGEQQMLDVYAPAAFHEADAQIVEVRGDEVQDGVDVVVRLNGLHTIHGRVLALSDRHGFTRSQISIKDDKGFRAFTFGDPNGNFHLDYLPEGTYELTALGLDMKRGANGSMVSVRDNKPVKLSVIVTARDQVLEDILIVDKKIK